VRPFRFGFQLRPGSAAGLAGTARAVEAAGFDVLHTWDHVVGDLGPLTPLAVAAAATTTLRVCPLVVNNDFHHPVGLAREIASMDVLSGGRVELGIGAGHAAPEYAALGLRFDPAPVRKARLAEAVELLRPLLAGEAVTHRGEHYRLEGAQVLAAAQSPLPLLVGVNGRAALAHAAAHADIVGLTMLGRTLEDGQRHTVRWEPERLDGVVAHVRAAAAAAGRPTPELNALVQMVVICDDRRAAAEAACEAIAGLSVEDALATPFLCLGTVEEIAEQLEAARERWGISYFSVRELEAFAPVIARLRRRAPR
jgi:probable F420-dependent oxidoreductase